MQLKTAGGFTDSEAFFKINPQKSQAQNKFLITGGTSDIAKAFRSELVRLGVEHDFTARAESSNPDFQLDYNNTKSVAQFINQTDFRIYSSIIFFTGFMDEHSNIVTASASKDTGPESIERAEESFDSHTQINALYPYLISRIISQQLKAEDGKNVSPSSSIKERTNFVFITSSIGTSNKGVFPGLYYYRAGKAALHAMLSALFLELNTTKSANTGASRFGILLLGPGSAKSRMNPYGSITTEESAKFITPIILDNSTYGLFLFMDHRKRRLYL